MSEINPRYKPGEVTIARKPWIVTEDELEDGFQAETIGSMLDAIASQIDPKDDPTLDQVFTCEQGPDGKIRPVTFREILYGNNPDAPPMGIMCSTTPKECMEPKNPFGHNRAARRAHARQARKRGGSEGHDQFNQSRTRRIRPASHASPRSLPYDSAGTRPGLRPAIRHFHREL